MKNGSQYEDLSPGGGTPILHGIKVVSLSTVIAAPMTAAILAHFGADVVKVEKLGGDPWRKFFKEFEQKRDFVSVCYQANRGKRSIEVDLKSETGRQTLLNIIKDADIFITNCRLKGLMGLKLDYPTLNKLFPQLIYVHITAWGLTGPLLSFPGYDTGAFWTMTGVSYLMHNYPKHEPDPGLYSMYPIGFGDLTTSNVLIFGIASSLVRRVREGKGSFVHASLFEAGYYVLSPYYCQLEEGKTNHHHTNITEECFYTRDMKRVQLCACPGTEKDQTVESLTKLFGKKGDSISTLRYKTRTALAKLHSNDLQILNRAKIPYEVVLQDNFSWDDYNKSMAANPPLKACLEPGRDKLEHKHVILPPFRLNCSKHGWNREPPSVGEHTKEIVSQPFPEYIKGGLPKSGFQIKSTKSSLEGINIVELSETGTTMASAARLLADQGASVTKVIVEGLGADYWERNGWLKFVDHLDSKKHVLRLGALSAEVVSQIINLLENSHAFLTNISLSTLIEHRLDPSTILKQFPKLVYTLCTPRGIKFSESGRSGMGSWFVGSGFSDKTTIASELPRRLPLQFAQTHTSCSVAAGTALALFHQSRTGEGQLCECSQLASATFCLSVHSAFNEANWVNFQFGAKRSRFETRNQLIPTVNSYKTKDGYWFMFLGVEYTKMLMPFCKALGLGWGVTLRLIKGFIYSKLAGNTAALATAVRSLNIDFTEVVSTMTRKEVEDSLTKGFNGDKWYCFVRNPITARKSEQAKALGIFQTSGHKFRLKSPLTLKYEQDLKVLSKL